METKQFKGVIPPVFALLLDRNDDQKFIGKLIDSMINAVGLFFLGTGGNSPKCQYEKEELVVRYVNHRVPVLIGTGSINTSEVIV